ncbi:MAG: esterase-like activity of phytase family protein [Sphingobium sp.]
MRRLLLILLLIILIAAAGLGWFYTKRDRSFERTANGPVLIRSEPLVLDSRNPSRTTLGDLHFLGAWKLTSPEKWFGGLSAMLIGPQGRIWALNDSGVMYIFPKPGGSEKGEAFRVRAPKKRPKPYRYPTDSESVTADPDFRNIWIGFEMVPRICRFVPDLRRDSRCRDWPEIGKWDQTESQESMVRLPDGRFLVIAEQTDGDGPQHEVLLFAGDPASPATPHPRHLSYIPPAGYKPTDAVWFDKDHLIVLNRRVTIYDGFTAVISVVDIGRLESGTVLKSREIARLVPPVLSDNFEGLAIEREDGQPILWVVSDDNHLFLQRTLLLKFALPQHF